MEVQVESAGGLARRMHVTIPAERVDREVGQRLKTLAARARIPGFRPGKVPMTVVKAQYGDSARMDVIGDLIRQTWPEAATQAKVHPAAAPQFEVTSEKQGEPLAYVASFEVLPEIKLDHLDGLKVTRPVVEIQDEDVERLIDNLRKSRRVVEKVERAAAAGDIAVIDFDGKIAGEAFQGGKGEKVEVEIGQKQFLADLENALIGHVAGDAFFADVHFPEDYRAEALRGKTAQFETTVSEVREIRLPEIDAEFLKSHGVEDGAGIEGLKAKCRTALESEREKASKAAMKKDLLDQLLAAHPIEVPMSQVGQEIARMRDETTQRMGMANSKQKPSPEQLQQMLPDQLFVEQAKRRVALGLLIGEAINSRGIQLDRSRVEKSLDDIAADYDEPEQVKQYYRSQPQMMQSLSAVVLEEQVVSSLLEGAQTIEKAMSLEELLKSQNQSAA